jgi:hypothetical protein
MSKDDRDVEDRLLDSLRLDMSGPDKRSFSELYVLSATTLTRLSALKELIKEWRLSDNEKLKTMQTQLDDHEVRLDELHDQNTRISLVWAAAGVGGAMLLELVVLWAAGILKLGT